MGTFRTRSGKKIWRWREPPLEETMATVLRAQLSILDETIPPAGAAPKRARSKPSGERKCSIDLCVRVGADAASGEAHVPAFGRPRARNA